MRRRGRFVSRGVTPLKFTRASDAPPPRVRAVGGS
jgi:hypothetical protein